jgi:S-adenosylmethionine-diacylglycerol 3-amino-3-carboxypropyl transferase
VPGPQTSSGDVAAARIDYAQCWEDADVLLEALDVQPGHTVLSIASGGDNTLALLTRAPGRVIAIDRNPAQVACLELRRAAWERLTHDELLQLVGSRPSAQRIELYQRCREGLSAGAREVWDPQPPTDLRGIGDAGRFEGYLRLFRESVLPCVQGRTTVAELLRGAPSREERERFYARRWDSWRWRLLFHLFFSRAVMSRVGRDPRLFRFVRGSVAARLLARARYAVTALDPAENPYLQWILTGRHTTALPAALRPESFAPIRAHLDRLDLRVQTLNQCLAQQESRSIDRFNLSDVFEACSPEEYQQHLTELVRVARPGARLVYWNMLARRRRPESLASALRPLSTLAEKLYAKDRAFFYSALVVEEVTASG